jgi:hypothetical protein
MHPEAEACDRHFGYELGNDVTASELCNAVEFLSRF